MNIIVCPFCIQFVCSLQLLSSLIPTCFICLQVGLAVDDIKGVQEKAALKKEALQVSVTLTQLYRSCYCYLLLLGLGGVCVYLYRLSSFLTC